MKNQKNEREKALLEKLRGEAFKLKKRYLPVGTKETSNNYYDSCCNATIDDVLDLIYKELTYYEKPNKIRNK